MEKETVEFRTYLDGKLHYVVGCKRRIYKSAFGPTINYMGRRSPVKREGWKYVFVKYIRTLSPVHPNQGD